MAKVITTDDVGAILHAVQVDEFEMKIPEHLREQAAMLRLRQSALMAETALLLSQVLPGVSFSEPDNHVDVNSLGSGFISSSISAWPTNDEVEIPMLLAGIDPEADWEPRETPNQAVEIAPPPAAPKPKPPSPTM